jgi:ubiquinone/menaquinone biosynthesis C-methylase UbiE
LTHQQNGHLAQMQGRIASSAAGSSAQTTSSTRGELTMGTSSTGTSGSASDWGSDFFGTLNEMPAEPVTGIGHILEAMSTLPAFRDARQWVLRNLGITQGSSVIEAGCGNAADLPDILSTVGTKGRVVGVDPTKAFVEIARTRAGQLGAANARFEIGDIRSIPAKDGEFDAAFCDKVLIHAGPPKSAVGEMVRVTRAGGRVGAIEWLPFFVVSASQRAGLDAFNSIFRKAVYDYFVSSNLARHFRAAGLKDVKTEALLAHTDNLDAHPFWRTFIVEQMPMFVHVGLIEEAAAQAFLADIEALNGKGDFSASFIVQAAVGTK